MSGSDRPKPIPILRVSGTHREVGIQVGRATQDVVRRAVAFSPGQLPPGRSMADQMALVREYRSITAAALPWLAEELDGVAQGAGVDPLELFAASIEEIWAARPSQAGAAPEHLVRGTAGRCSDIVATAPVTSDRHTWIAHTNDLSAASEADVVAIEWRVPTEPVAFTLGIGPWISVGWNSAGLALSGNELTPNDERVGVPRLLMVRDQLTRRTLTEAVAAALRPDRSSSYNTVFADQAGDVVDVEGSATDAELVRPDVGGCLVHTNHYACDRMRHYEGDIGFAARSARRYNRAQALLRQAPLGSVDAAVLMSILADHENAPDSICRHPVPGNDTKTVFWALTDAIEGRITFGRGNPCRPIEQHWRYLPAG